MSRKTLEPFEAVCSWCERSFCSESSIQLGAMRAGKKIYCSRSCSSASEREKGKHRHTCGPCPTCGKMFRAHIKSKKYCTIDCYLESDQLAKTLRNANEKRKLPPKTCPNCGLVYQHKNKKYCSNICRREYWAARFDRFIANPEKIALPQNFDEYMTKTKLPCLVEGCDWEGENLATHINYVHGITADKFREMAGFNCGTGLVGKELHRRMSERMKLYISDGRIDVGHFPPEHRAPGKGGSRGPFRLEAKEHSKKSRAILMAEGDPPPDIPCRQCGEPVTQPVMGKRLYCSTRCRSRYYQESKGAELICSFCGATFMALWEQVKRAQRAEKVCCSHMCRNRMNMVACLAARNIKWGP